MAVAASTVVDATCGAIAVDWDGPRIGIALLGPPGAGKTSALTDLITHCRFGRSRLIADDRTEISAPAGRLLASAVPPIAGLVELRGHGLAPLPATPHALHLAFDLTPDRERLPAPATWSPLGEKGPAVPKYGFPATPSGVIPVIRGLLTGHLLQCGILS